MSKTAKLSNSSGQKIIDYYRKYNEQVRLKQSTGQLEFVRTKEILNRFLPAPPAIVYDIGGAAGSYSLWLARHGYEVHLVDLVPEHIEKARFTSQQQAAHPIASLTVGDARNIDRKSESVDAVLLMGPLYHLEKKTARYDALREAYRILRDGGIILCAAISRFASLFNGLRENYLEDPVFMNIVRQDLKTGVHQNPTDNPEYFTTSYFHHPDELREELEAADFEFECTLAVESIGNQLPDFDNKWQDLAWRERLLNAIRLVEEEPSLLGIGDHLIAVARKVISYDDLAA